MGDMTPEREKYVYEWLVTAMRLINAFMAAACIVAWLYLLALNATDEMHKQVADMEMATP